MIEVLHPNNSHRQLKLYKEDWDGRWSTFAVRLKPLGMILGLQCTSPLGVVWGVGVGFQVLFSGPSGLQLSNSGLQVRRLPWGGRFLVQGFLGFRQKGSLALLIKYCFRNYIGLAYQVNIDMYEALYAGCCTSSEQGLGFGSCSTVWVRGHKVLQHPPSTL